MAVDAVLDSSVRNEAADRFVPPSGRSKSRPNPGNGKIESINWRYNDAAAGYRRSLAIDIQM